MHPSPNTCLLLPWQFSRSLFLSEQTPAPVGSKDVKVFLYNCQNILSQHLVWTAAKFVTGFLSKARNHLVLSGMFHDLFIHNLIHDLETLDGLLLCNANIRLLQRHRTETRKETRTVEI